MEKFQKFISKQPVAMLYVIHSNAQMFYSYYHTMNTVYQYYHIDYHIQSIAVWTV